MSRRTHWLAQRALLALAAAFAIWFGAAVVRAQPRDRPAAEELFRSGREALARGDHATACQRFEESNRLEPAAGTVMNLANCREQLGQIASAWQRYREALEKLPPEDDRVALARKRASALEPRLPRLTLKLAASAPPGTVVVRDGIELGSASLGLALPVDPGEHLIVVRAPGRAPRQVRFSLAESEKHELVLEPGTVETKPAAGGEQAVESSDTSESTRPARSPSGNGRRTLGFVIGGAGVAALAVSLTAGAIALSKKAAVEDNCSGTRCNQRGLDAGESGKTLVTVSNIAFGAGVLGLGVGTYLVLSSGSNGEQTAIGPAFVASGAGFSARGRF